MVDSEAARISHAATAGTDRIIALLHDPSPQVIRTLLGNGNLREEDVLVVAGRKNLPADVFGRIAGDERWLESYPVRLALARNPKTPLSVSLSIVRHLRLFDIAEMTRSHHLPLAFRHKLEAIVTERIPTMPLGYKKSLAKKAVGAVLFRLLQDAEAEVAALCLDNPRLTEGHLFKIISRRETQGKTVRLIAAHKSWSGRPLIRFALVRNDHTPLAFSERFMQTMKLQDLRELYSDPALPAAVKPLVHRELLDRGQNPEVTVEERVFDIDENDDVGMEDIGAVYEEGDE
jgi:hypothetical protein